MHISRDLLSGILLMAISLIVYIQSLSFPLLPEGYPGPSLFPQILALSLGLMGVGLLIVGFRKPKAQPPSAPQKVIPSSGWGRILGGMAAIALYPLSYPYIAPLQSSLGLAFNPMLGLMGLSLFILTLITKVPLRTAILVSITAPLLVYLIFTQFLGVAI